MNNLRHIGRAMLAVIALLLIAAPVGAMDAVVDSGVDLWTTPGNGQTFKDFAFDPIPADFFCAGSKPFTGRVAFRGVPISTEPAGAFGDADTVVLRLDDAVFNRRGVARTRLQVKALSLISVEPVDTGCGLYHVRAIAVAEQPITSMKILRDGEDGGRFQARVQVNVRLTFLPVDGDGPSFEVMHFTDFPINANAAWSSRPAETHLVRHEGFVVIDTDGDGRTDTFVPGTSLNFAAGWGRGGSVPTLGDSTTTQLPKETSPEPDGHCTTGGSHCHIFLTPGEPTK